METKELFERLEKELSEKDAEAGELIGGYFLIVSRQEGLQVVGKYNDKLLVNGISRLFEILVEENKELSLKLLATLCAQTLAERLQEERG
ncbi:MAG: hypothetical protein E6276_05165 [Clostridiales bacterium]|nr:hypothetical protein [Peptococcus niger]MDU7244764.1 hypothetical protein [Clostridiales bacterium]